MKKILFFAATATMLFAACTNEDLVAPQTGAETTLEDGAVGFDVYVPGATAQTRAGRAGVMTTTTMQQTGFGIFGYQTDEEKTNFAVAGYVSGTSKPNYMWNQQVNYSKNPSAWYYSPLKYWPNETNNDSQSAMMPDVSSHNHLDRLTFFAYAPWVRANSADGLASNVNAGVGAKESAGIYRLTAQDGKQYSDGSALDAQITYNVATDPNESVDLLWGVAPAGGISYKNVTGSTTTIPEGLPLIDLVKPAVNTSLKFQFQHALARFGVKVVLAADQVAPGGNFDYANTKVTIEKIELKSKGFGTSGMLNLKNTVKFEPNWKYMNKADGSTGNPVLTIAKGKGLAEHLCYDATRNTGDTKTQQVVTGVTTDQADAIQVTSKYDAQNTDDYVSKLTNPNYSPITPFFKAQGDVVRTGGAPNYATYNDWAPKDGLTYLQKCVTNNGVAYTDITKTINAKYPTATVWKEIYTLDHAIKAVTAENRAAVAALTAYRLVGKTYTATGQKPEIGDYVFWTGYAAATPAAVKAPEYSGTYYAANPNYFMVIPYNGATDEYKKISVKITYYVSTTDASLKDGIVYTKNEVEKDVVLPHLKNGVAYDLRLILGLTSVKVEADVADWTTTGATINLPQNTAE